ncbi:MAG TPA: agmatinase [Kofleriaceae bacterium]|jgi:agmatinase|nr:agmatinase [Kofleriaceae bacterium]
MASSDHAFTAPTLYGKVDDNTGALSFLGRRFTRDLAGVDVVISGIAYDLGTSGRPGSRFGPRGLRLASDHIAWGPQWPFDFDPTHRLAIIDWGDHKFERYATASMVAAVEANTVGFLEAGCFPMTMGGDHFVTLPLLRAMAKHHGAGLSLVHFDAHHDTDRSERLNHGSVFWHAMQEGLIDPARSIHIGVREHNFWDDGFHVIDGRQAQKWAPEAIAERVLEVTGGNRAYLSFDIDFLDPSCAPGTGTPLVGGPNTTTALEILGLLGRLKLVGMDLVEVAPDYDVSEITVLAGATIMYQVLHLLALDKRVAPGMRRA